MLKTPFKARAPLTCHFLPISFRLTKVPRNTENCARLRNEYDFVRGLIGTKDSILATQTLPLVSMSFLMYVAKLTSTYF